MKNRKRRRIKRKLNYELGYHHGHEDGYKEGYGDGINHVSEFNRAKKTVKLNNEVKSVC